MIAVDYAGTALLCDARDRGRSRRGWSTGRRSPPSRTRGRPPWPPCATASGSPSPQYAAGLGAEDVLQLEPESYRVCVPGPDPERWLCHIVDVDRDPPRVVRDDSMEPNSALRTVGGFH